MNRNNLFSRNKILAMNSEETKEYLNKLRKINLQSGHVLACWPSG
jgi:hypothetical protein